MRRAFFAALLFCCLASGAGAQQIQVSPSSVNAYSQGATTAFLTYSNLKGKRPAESCWCGELTPASPGGGSRCDPATLFGCLPARYDQSTASGNAAYTDIMSIPPSVARRAYLDAAGGATATFFYVRRFVSTTGGADEFVPVTIRLSGNGVATPFSLTDVKLSFAIDKPVLFLRAGEKVPKLQAEITYTGSGRLKGRWEIVKPGEELPADRDLLTEATLPVEERGLQRRYAQLSRFNVFLPPAGRFTLPGPETWRLQNPAEGMYLILLRIEATDDKTSDSDLGLIGAGAGVTHSGAVGGFPMPVLRYYIGSGTESTGGGPEEKFALVSPTEKATLEKNRVAEFNWTAAAGAALYRIELAEADEALILSAVLLPDTSSYRAPSWLRERVQDREFRWRVVALDLKGTKIAESDWRRLRFRR